MDSSVVIELKLWLSAAPKQSINHQLHSYLCKSILSAWTCAALHMFVCTVCAEGDRMNGAWLRDLCYCSLEEVEEEEEEDESTDRRVKLPVWPIKKKLLFTFNEKPVKIIYIAEVTTAAFTVCKMIFSLHVL